MKLGSTLPPSFVEVLKQSTTGHGKSNICSAISLLINNFGNLALLVFFQTLHHLAIHIFVWLFCAHFDGFISSGVREHLMTWEHRILLVKSNINPVQSFSTGQHSTGNFSRSSQWCPARPLLLVHTIQANGKPKPTTTPQVINMPLAPSAVPPVPP
jgi:hypothetical protein